MYNIVDEIMNNLPTDSSGKWISVTEIRKVLEDKLLPTINLYDTEIYNMSDYQKRKVHTE